VASIRRSPGGKRSAGNRGQLGDGRTTIGSSHSGGRRLTFAALSRVTRQLRPDPTGAAYCGLQQSGQLGDGTTTIGSPTRSPGLDVRRADAGNNAGGHTCGVTTSGAAYCLGRKANGQLGECTTTDGSCPHVGGVRRVSRGHMS